MSFLTVHLTIFPPDPSTVFLPPNVFSTTKYSALFSAFHSAYLLWIFPCICFTSFRVKCSIFCLIFSMSSLVDTYLLLYSLSHFQCDDHTCSLNSMYRPHWLVQWSHCSCMRIPVLSPWLPGYINVLQTILIILTATGLFPDRPCIISLAV